MPLKKVGFQLTAARRRLDMRRPTGGDLNHFNSQPREGGWDALKQRNHALPAFQLTAARRRLETSRVVAMILDNISTHSRAKAAGIINPEFAANNMISTHSRAKAAGRVP